MGDLINYLRKNYSIYLNNEEQGFDGITILQIIKDLEGEKEELREDKQSLEEKIKRLKREKMFIEMDNHTTKEDIGYLKTENEELKEENQRLKKKATANFWKAEQMANLASNVAKQTQDKDNQNSPDHPAHYDFLRYVVMNKDNLKSSIFMKEKNDMGLDLFEVLIARKSESVWGEEIDTVYVMAANETQVLQTIEEKSLLGEYNRIEIKPLEYIQ